MEDDPYYVPDCVFDGSAYGSSLAWRKLLHLPFERVTLLVTNDRNSGTNTANASSQVLLKFLRGILKSLGETIGHNWQSYQIALDFYADSAAEYNPPEHHFNEYDEYDPTPKRAWYDSAEEFRIARVQHKRLENGGGRDARYRFLKGDDKGLEARRIQTRQLCYAWNLLPLASPLHGKLTGQKFMYTPERVESLRKTNEIRELKYENAWPHRYEVSSADGLVGEMGFHHPKRWELASEEYDDYRGWMRHFEYAEEVESKGIGMKLTKARKPRVKKEEKGDKMEEEIEEGEMDGQ